MKTECWATHRVRVASLFPELTARMDAWKEKERAMREFQGREPYSGVMMGNIQDGLLIAEQKPPQARGDGTLTWPLTPRTPKES